MALYGTREEEYLLGETINILRCLQPSGARKEQYHPMELDDSITIESLIFFMSSEIFQKNSIHYFNY
jgi:hypothetical protein